MPNARISQVSEGFNRFAERIGAPSRCDPTLSFVAPQLTQALAVWRAKANGKDIPSRRSLDAHALRAFLPNVCLVDVVDGPTPRYRMRLIGTALARLLGDHTG
jgi:hypothetical protein